MSFDWKKPWSMDKRTMAFLGKNKRKKSKTFRLKRRRFMQPNSDIQKTHSTRDFLKMNGLTIGFKK